MTKLIGEDSAYPAGVTDPVEGVCKDPVDRALCDWYYDPGDWSVGINGGWVCRECGAEDANRMPPSENLDD